MRGSRRSAALTEAGIPTGILIAPLMPGINDAPEQVERIIELADEAGATSIGGITLHLRPGVRDVFMDWLRGARPDLVERYERLYERRAYVRDSERWAIERPLREHDDGRPRGALRGPPREAAAGGVQPGRLEGDGGLVSSERERRPEPLQLF